MVLCTPPDFTALLLLCNDIAGYLFSIFPLCLPGLFIAYTSSANLRISCLFKTFWNASETSPSDFLLALTRCQFVSIPISLSLLLESVEFFYSRICTKAYFGVWVELTPFPFVLLPNVPSVTRGGFGQPKSSFLCYIPSL